MSLFSKIEIKPEMESFIRKGEGVGVVKVDDYGKASARIESHKVILESYDEDYPIIESIAAISYLSYDPGNFFQEPKLEIGVGQKKFILAGVDNNDDELEAFYKSILNLKKQETQQQTTETNATPVVQDKANGGYDELDELEEELENKPKSHDKTSKIKGFLSKRFEEKEETKEPIKQEDDLSSVKKFINRRKEKTNTEKVDAEKVDAEKVDAEKVDDLELILDENGSLDDDEEIILLEEESKEKPKEKTNVQKEEIENIEEYDEFDEFDEIDDFSELDDDEIVLDDDIEFEEVLLEEDIGDLTSEEPVEKTSINKEVTEQKVSTQQQAVVKNQDINKQNEEKSSGGINKIKNQVKGLFTEEIDEKESENQIETSTQQTVTQKTVAKPKPAAKPKQTTVKTLNTETQLNKEISQVKEQVNKNINNINQQISDQETKNIETANTSDPVYQIRRYYELKEDGIITEEEFQQKKKQLLGL